MEIVDVGIRTPIKSQRQLRTIRDPYFVIEFLPESDSTVFGL